MSEYNKIILDTRPTDPSAYKPGQRGYFHSPENGLVIIGENDTHVYTILDSNGAYYGIFKHPENLKELHGI